MTKNQSVRSVRDSSGLRNGAILIVVVAALYLARDLLIPLAFAIILSVILAPAVALLQKLYLGRVAAALIVIVAATGSVGFAGWVLFNDLVEVATELPGYQENIHRKIEAINAPGDSALGRAADSVKGLREALAPQTASEHPSVTRNGRRVAATPAGPLSVQVVETPSNELQYVRELAMPFLRPVAVFGMVLIFSLYLLIEHHDLRNRLFRLVGVNQLNVMTLALDDATRRVSRYLMLQLLVNVCFGALCAIGLYFIGVPYPALWGAVAAILRWVPYVGSIVAAGLPLLLSLAVFDGWKPLLMVFLLYGSLELTTGNFIEPWLYGIHTGVSSLALLLTTVFWAAVWGPAGLIMSTPLTVCVVVLGRYVPQFSFLHVLLGDEAPLVAEARIYQRLLAMDEQEARSITDEYLKDHTLADLYDSVMVPMLTMAEQDRHKGALDPTREEFLFLSVKEILVELPAYSLQASPAIADHPVESARIPPTDATPDSPDGSVAEAVEVAPMWPAGRVICIPANDEADEITASMLSQLLELRGCVALSFPANPDLLKQLELLEPSTDDVICISSLPPFAFSHAKTLSHKLRVNFPLTKIVVGVWGFAGEIQPALERFQAPRPNQLVTTLQGAVLAIAELTRLSAEAHEPAGQKG